MIGGVFLLLATAIGGYFATRRPEAVPPLEIKTITGGKEQVLATIALRPESHLVDSASFADLATEYVLVNDTLGIAIKKPTEYRWTAGRMNRPGGVSLYDIPLIAFYSEEQGKMWGIDSNLSIPYYGVGLDQPFAMRVTAATSLSGIPFGANPFAKPEIGKLMEDYYFSDDAYATWFDRQKYRKEIIHMVDSLNLARLPVTENLYSGVFVSPITQDALPKFAGIGWHYLDLFEKVAFILGMQQPPDDLLYIDRQRHLMVFNESLHLRNVQVDGVDREAVIVNRVGYAILVGEVVYLVQLQYLSGQSEETLDELQDYFRSVQLRSASSSPK
jgi:hypothetical protein